MAKKATLSDDDKAVFAEAMRNVKKLSYTKSSIEPPTHRPNKQIIRKPEADEEEEIFFSDYEKIDLVNSEDVIEFARDGLQKRSLHQLRKGQNRIEATLDLHGKTVEESRQALSHFLLHCQKNNKRYALIIHGKGRSHSKPIIKNKLNQWLRQLDSVLAFCSAMPKDGGHGALYVLLRRPK